MKLFKNQKGFTLVEMIGVIALLSLIVVALSTFLITGEKTKQTNRQYSELQVKTNVMLRQMQQYYDTHSGVQDLPYIADASKIRIQDIRINGETKETVNPIPNVDFDEPLHIQLTVTAPNHHTLEPLYIETSWSPNISKELTVKQKE